MGRASTSGARAGDADDGAEAEIDGKRHRKVHANVTEASFCAPAYGTAEVIP